jgi:septum formation protein
MKPIILASASPRRKDLLTQIGINFEIDPSNYEEEKHLNLEPHKLAKYLSLQKAKDVATRHKKSIIIAADTFVVFEGKIIGKPSSEEEARERLNKMNGRCHSVITGFTIIDTEINKIISKSVDTKVYFKNITSEEIDSYVASKEPMDKAGAYAIQGLGGILVDKIEGDYYNVVGLPLAVLVEELKNFGIKVL